MRKTGEEIRRAYRQRLILPEYVGDDEIIFYTHSGFEVAKWYERVVIGDRGPYIEFCGEMLSRDIYVPADQEWRLRSESCYYIEWRTRDESRVKIYNQVRPVSYADYKVGMWYISPFDLTSNLYPTLVRPLDG